MHDELAQTVQFPLSRFRGRETMSSNWINPEPFNHLSSAVRRRASNQSSRSSGQSGNYAACLRPSLFDAALSSPLPRTNSSLPGHEAELYRRQSDNDAWPLWVMSTRLCKRDKVDVPDKLQLNTVQRNLGSGSCCHRLRRWDAIEQKKLLKHLLKCGASRTLAPRSLLRLVDLDNHRELRVI